MSLWIPHLETTTFSAIPRANSSLTYMHETLTAPPAAFIVIAIVVVAVAPTAS